MPDPFDGERFAGRNHDVFGVDARAYDDRVAGTGSTNGRADGRIPALAQPFASGDPPDPGQGPFGCAPDRPERPLSDVLDT